MTQSIVIFLPSLAGGGAERLHINQAPELAKLGYNITFLVNLKIGSLCDQLPSGIKTECLNAANTLQTIIPLYRFLRQNKPDILLCNLHICNMAGLVMKLIPWIKTKIITSFHCTLTPISRRNKSLSTRLRSLVYRYFLWLSDAVVAVSEGVKDDVLTTTLLPKEKIHVIYNPVITDAFIHAAEQAQAALPDRDRESYEPLILGVGRFTVQKDFKTLISAFAKVRTTQKCRLRLLGEGPFRDRLIEQIQSLGLTDQVELPGFLKNPVSSFCEADVFVLSSLYEGLGNVLIEAMACGTPVISTDCPSGPAEILENGKYGHLVPVGDVEALAQAIRKTLAAPLPKEKLRERGLYFTAARAAQQYHKVCLSVL